MGFEIIVVGASTGGLKALPIVLSRLPADFPLPIVIVQHRGKNLETSLCDFLNQTTLLPVSEPEDKEAIHAGRVYLAPRDYHLLIESGSFALSTEPPIGYARPSIDVFFQSAADEYRERAIGVILTGVGNDGAQGLAAIKAGGGFALVESPASAACAEMPRAALERTQVDAVLPLEDLVSRLEQLSRMVMVV